MKQFAPAAERNRDPLCAALAPLLATQPSVSRRTILEIASGTGQHAAAFARRFADFDWQPSDVDERALSSIRAYRSEAGLPNLLDPIALNARETWPLPADRDWHAVVCINMIHIAPWPACVGLFEGSARLLSSGRALILYGPFRFHGRFTAPSNAAFDEHLRTQDPDWGVRDAEDLRTLAESTGFVPHEPIALPANNHVLTFQRR